MGVVLNGTVFIKDHSQDIMQPVSLGRAVSGFVLGFDEIDEKLTGRVQTWLLAQEPTEVVFFSSKTFKLMWRRQKL